MKTKKQNKKEDKVMSKRAIKKRMQELRAEYAKAEADGKWHQWIGDIQGVRKTEMKMANILERKMAVRKGKKEPELTDVTRRSEILRPRLELIYLPEHIEAV